MHSAEILHLRHRGLFAWEAVGIGCVVLAMLAPYIDLTQPIKQHGKLAGEGCVYAWQLFPPNLLCSSHQQSHTLWTLSEVSQAAAGPDSMGLFRNLQPRFCPHP